MATEKVTSEVLTSELNGLVRDIEAFRAEIDQLGNGRAPAVDHNPTLPKHRESVMEASHSFMFKHWHDVLSRAANEHAVQETLDRPVETQEQLAALYHAADNEVQEVLASMLNASAARDQAHGTLVQRRNELDKVLQLLETEYQRLQHEEQAGGTHEEMGGGTREVTHDEHQPSLQSLVEEDQRLSKQYEELEANKKALEVEVDEYQGQLQGLRAEVQEAEQVLQAGGASCNMEVAGEKEELQAETKRVEERAEWSQAVLKAMEVLQGVRAEVCKGGFEGVHSGGGSEGEKTYVLRLTYLSSEHTLDLTLNPHPAVRIIDAKLRAASHVPALDVGLHEILSRSSTMAPPDDLMFVAREVGSRLDSLSYIQTEIATLRQSYVVKHTEGRDVTLSFKQGVVCTVKLLPGYPQLPGSLRFTSLVGVGGWRDAELGALCRALNYESPDTLIIGIKKLQENLVELDAAT